jgi:hypothetical protein
MLSGHRSAWRRRGRNSRAARIAVPLAIPMALGLTLGVILAVSGHGTTTIDQSALGSCTGAGPSASASADPSASPVTPASPCASSTPSTSVSQSSTATAVAATNVNCDIIVPANPLSAKGLATPYQLTGTDGQSPAVSGCEMTNAANLGAFVQATILNPATGQLYVYDPLVITQGTTPLVTPPVPTLPRNAVVTIDFGFNGTDLFQVGATSNALQQGNCINGQPGSIFGQVSYCNGINFFRAADQDEAEGKLVVPSEGTSDKIVATDGAMGTGQDCPVTHNFDMIDQDPSDNVTTEYLLDPTTGQTAEDSQANQGNFTNTTLLVNGSDNTLLDLFMDPTLGCTPFEAPTLSNGGIPGSSEALDELLSEKNEPNIPALVPENDEMVLNNDGQFDAAKTNLYRVELGQTPIDAANNKFDGPASYCQNMTDIQPEFLQANEALLATGQPPVAGVGDNLFTFLANRLSMSFVNLDCSNFGLTNPVTVTLNGDGVAIAATFNTTQQTATNTGSTSATPGPWMPGSHDRIGRKHHELMNPSGM